MKPMSYSTLLQLALLGVLSMPARAEITDCDRLASHPSDPDKVLPGFERKDIDLPKAEATCRAVIAADDRRARAHYLLGRVLFYQKKTPAAILELERSAALGYRQAIFVLGHSPDPWPATRAAFQRCSCSRR